MALGREWPPAVEDSLLHGGVWERITFTVGKEYPADKVAAFAEKAKRRGGAILEGKYEGYSVRYMKKHELDSQQVGVPEGMARYVIWAWCSRRPHEITMDMPPALVPWGLRRGMKLL